jgi:hypothetical protein
MATYRFKLKRQHPTLKRPVWSLQYRDCRLGTWIEAKEVDTLTEEKMRETVKVLNQVAKLNEEQQVLVGMML